MRDTNQAASARVRRVPLRSILGVALLIGCFVLALQMREQERAERAPKPAQADVVVAKKSVVSKASDVSVVRIARRGQASLTFMIGEDERAWRLDGVEHELDQARVRAIIEQVIARCTSGDTLTEEELAASELMAELLVEDWRVALRFEEGEGLGERIYWLERQGMRCSGSTPVKFDEQVARSIVPVSPEDVMARRPEGGGQ